METENKWKEKEEEWIKRSIEYEKKLAVIEIVLEDYDLQLKWTNGELIVTDLLYDREEEEE